MRKDLIIMWMLYIENRGRREGSLSDAIWNVLIFDPEDIDMGIGGIC